jgi:hypothetical protein
LLVPPFGAIDDIYDKQHQGNLDENTDDRGKRGAGVKAKQTYCRGNSELEEIRGSNQSRRTGDRVTFADSTIKCEGEARIKKHLNQDRYRKQGDRARLL